MEKLLLLSWLVWKLLVQVFRLVNGLLLFSCTACFGLMIATIQKKKKVCYYLISVILMNMMFATAFLVH